MYGMYIKIKKKIGPLMRDDGKYVTVRKWNSLIYSFVFTQKEKIFQPIKSSTIKKRIEIQVKISKW